MPYTFQPRWPYTGQGVPKTALTHTGVSGPTNALVSVKSTIDERKYLTDIVAVQLK